ncbi:uncharacterized protein LOC114528378 [Dendronephthya gigantea]|uniref:uncharacterized protein LOC114528378 n=1 Tax=Dendronephthya gigantea TaxID=151771 RepID=UPI00106D51FD|nr:uncharacterized protein LOC114528378 [Dendronephthya gigantea]
MKIDVVFVIDKSGSIGRKNFEFVKNFVKMFIEYFPVFPSKTRVAIVSYSTYRRLEFNFNENRNRKCLRGGIKKMRYTNGRTSTGNALELVRTRLIYNSKAGAREQAKKLIFVITDGKSNLGIDPGVPAGKLKQNDNVSIVAVGVTNKINQTELQSIASSPSHVIHVKDFDALKKLTQSLKDDLSKKCENGKTVLDECGRRCRCKDGLLVDCCRLRKEFTQLSKEELIRYINAVKKASTDPRYKRKYDQLLTLHVELFRRIHKKDFFLTWHRWFLLQYENLLRKIDCRVTLPYWDWTLVAGKPFTFGEGDFWASGEEGFGGNGSPPGGCVKTGPFREGEWSLIRSAGGGCLKRNFNGRFPDLISLASLLKSTSKPEDFSKFESQLRVVFHNNVACGIGGTMCTKHGASAPEFFPHHGFIDKIWSDWQKQSPAHKFHKFFKYQKGDMPATRGYRSRDFLDLSNQPDCVCVDYGEARNNVSKLIKGLPLSTLQNIPRLSLSELNANATTLFQTSADELEKLSKLRATIAPKVIFKGSLNGTDASFGFRISDVLKAKG